MDAETGRTKHRDESDNWQLLSSVVWAGQGPYSVRIAMVGKRGNKLELFNRQAGTSYPHNDTFNKMLQPPPPPPPGRVAARRTA